MPNTELNRPERKLSDVHKRRIGAANRGRTRTLTEQHRRNIAEGQAAYCARVKLALAHLEAAQPDFEGVEG
jgi:hypothetical protein